MKTALMILLVALLTGPAALRAQTSDDADLRALTETQNLLRNPQLRQQALTTPQAREADRNAAITGLGNSDYQQEIYNLSAELMPWLVEQSKGDPAKMAELMQEFQKNPRAFFNRVPAAQRARISALADKIEKARSPSAQRNP